MGDIVPLNPDGTPWQPAFEGQRPPFQAGNEVAIKHGAFTPKRVNPIAHGYIAGIQADPGLAYLTRPAFADTLWLWATAMARVQILEAWVDDMNIDDAANSDRGKKSPLDLLGTWSTRAATYASRLGLDPLSAARLGKDIAQGRQADAAGELTRLRAQHEAATRKRTPDDPPTPPNA